MPESHYERRQREAAQRMLKAAMPDVQRVVEDLRRQQAYMANISQLFSTQYQDMLASITQGVLSDIDRVKFEVPALKLDYQSLFPDFAGIHADAIKSLQPSIELIQHMQRQQFVDIFATARAAIVAAVPPNWLGDRVSIPKNLDELLLDEGLPLAWVPPGAVIERLFAAKTPVQRRKIIGDRWRMIAEACLTELQQIENSGLAEHVKFALKSTNVLLQAEPEASQALSTNLLDSILRAEFSGADRQAITGQHVRLSIDDYPLRVAIVFGGIWGAHEQYWPERGDQIPRKYSRHGSAHGVSRRQYSRINSVLALMHVVSLLKVMEVDLAEY